MGAGLTTGWGPLSARGTLALSLGDLALVIRDPLGEDALSLFVALGGILCKELFSVFGLFFFIIVVQQAPDCLDVLSYAAARP